MTKRKLLIIGLVLIFFALVGGGFFLLQFSRGSRQVRIELTGAPSVQVKGTVEADGVVSEYELMLPATLTLQGDHITYKFRKVAGPLNEAVKAEVFVEGVRRMMVQSQHGVRGTAGSDRFMAGLFGRGHSMAAGMASAEE